MSEAEKDAFSAIKETKAHLHAQAAYTEQDLRQRLIDEGCSCDVLCGYYCGFHKALANYEARIRSEARAGMREACAEVAEALALKLCWHCAEHVKNGYKFMGYGHTEVDLDSGDARQIYAAVGTGENWSHLIRTESGLEWSEKCKAWMLWSIVYGTPDPAADEAIERIKREARLDYDELKLAAWHARVMKLANEMEHYGHVTHYPAMCAKCRLLALLGELKP